MDNEFNKFYAEFTETKRVLRRNEIRGNAGTYSVIEIRSDIGYYDDEMERFDKIFLKVGENRYKEFARNGL